MLLLTKVVERAFVLLVLVLFCVSAIDEVEVAFLMNVLL